MKKTTEHAISFPAAESRTLRVRKTSVRTVSAVSAAPGQALPNDASNSEPSEASGASVRNLGKRQAGVRHNSTISLKNDANDAPDARFPILLGADYGRPDYGRVVESGVTNGSTWTIYETPDRRYIRKGYDEA